MSKLYCLALTRTPQSIPDKDAVFIRRAEHGETKSRES
jgi:hypothetical protein